MNEVINSLSSMLEGKVVTTREEVERKAVRAILKSKSFEAINLDYNFVGEVVNSYFECPVSLNCIHFSEKVEIAGIPFFHIHTSKPNRDQLEEAYEEYLISKRFLNAVSKIDSILDRFFKDYYVKNGVVREYSNEKYRYAVFYSLINDVGEDIDSHVNFAENYDGEYVIVTLTEKNPKPFIKFFRNYSEKIKAANIKIWVADVDNECIDPFIGYPRDFKLLKGFKNPKLASIINSLWRVQVKNVD